MILIANLLTCPHCCGIARAYAPQYDESMRGPCAACGFPGRVVLSVGSGADGYPDLATWVEDEDPCWPCNDPACVRCECVDAREAAGRQ